MLSKTCTIFKFSVFNLQAILTSIVLKRNVTMLDIVSTRMLGQYGFLAKVRVHAFQTCHRCHWMPSVFHTFTCIQQVFSIFEDLGISVDVVATSEVSVSLTLDPSKLWSRELIQQASVRHFYIFDQFVYWVQISLMNLCRQMPAP